MRKTPHRKRVTRSVRPRTNVDPARMALAAVERIRTVLVRSGHEERIGTPIDPSELEARAAVVGRPLPPSYVAAMRVASRIGDPEVFLASHAMKLEADRIARLAGAEAKRYAPFCKDVDHVFCFDKDASGSEPSLQSAEMPIVVWHDSSASPSAAHFGEWLDAIADAREDSLESAAEIPPRLKQLLYDLGFRFEYPVIGRLETGDTDAVSQLLGDALTRQVRGDVDRLFDSSGKASLSLNVDEYTLAVSLRTGMWVFEAEDVFRWLRTFRDENFFSDAVTVSAHANVVRDLRRAPREPPLIQRAALAVRTAPAKNLVFRSASGEHADDFYLLARTASTSERGPSIILHVVDGEVAMSHKVEVALNDLHVTTDGTIWGITTTHAVRISNGRTQSFPLPRPSQGHPWWYGIGGTTDRLLVWGAGALLEFGPRGFVPFEPDAMLDEGESIVALHPMGREISMLVCSEGIGAVAHFDAVSWRPITEHQVIGANLLSFDAWRGVAHVVDRDGGVWKIDGGPPRPVAFLSYHQAYLTDTGVARPIHGVRAWSGGLLLASTGGVIAVGGAEPLFHATPNGKDAVRLVRIEQATAAAAVEEAAIIALSGPHAWIWRGDGFSPIDVRDW